ncbi:MAG: hypothetical protein NC253_01915 [Ruminococcus sp.]|nr:hypothetical protein [Ruminococcus sp.]MCM1382541.1 hypothetical protein [Muribaculaceae bacterium]MCM1478051.1 hypothetical protein [Muribaculaceae bacterium]
MLKKLKKIIPAVVSAALCVTMAFGAAVSAEKKTASDVNVWSDSKALAGAKYYSTYIKLASKYSEKESKNTVAYSKSRTKKFLDRFEKAAQAKNPRFWICYLDKNSVYCYAVKGNNTKTVMCESGVGLALYSDGETGSYLDIENKTKLSFEDDTTGAEYAADLELDLGIAENAVGKVFKFKSGEKIYYYEEFEEDYGVVGMLFNENGSPLAVVEDDEVYCFSFKTKVDDSEFVIPKEYKDVDYDEFYGY